MSHCLYVCKNCASSSPSCRHGYQPSVCILKLIQAEIKSSGSSLPDYSAVVACTESEQLQCGLTTAHYLTPIGAKGRLVKGHCTLEIGLCL